MNNGTNGKEKWIAGVGALLVATALIWIFAAVNSLQVDAGKREEKIAAWRSEFDRYMLDEISFRLKVETKIENSLSQTQSSLAKLNENINEIRIRLGQDHPRNVYK